MINLHHSLVGVIQCVGHPCDDLYSKRSCQRLNLGISLNPKHLRVLLKRQSVHSPFLNKTSNTIKSKPWVACP